MRTNTHWVSGIFVTTSTDDELAFAKAKDVLEVIRSFVTTKQWVDGATQTSEYIKTNFTGIARCVFAVELDHQLRNGQLRAYENRLREIARAVNKYLEPLSSTRVSVKLLITKPLDLSE